MRVLDALLEYLFSALAHLLRRLFRRDNFFFAKAIAGFAIVVILIWAGHPPTALEAYLGFVLGGLVCLVLAAVHQLQKTIHQLEDGRLPAIYPPMIRARKLQGAGLIPLGIYQAATGFNPEATGYYSLLLAGLYLATCVDLRPPSWIGRLDRKALEALARLTRPRHRPFHV